MAQTFEEWICKRWCMTPELLIQACGGKGPHHPGTCKIGMAHVENAVKYGEMQAAWDAALASQSETLRALVEALKVALPYFERAAEKAYGDMNRWADGCPDTRAAVVENSRLANERLADFRAAIRFGEEQITTEETCNSTT